MSLFQTSIIRVLLTQRIPALLTDSVMAVSPATAVSRFCCSVVLEAYHLLLHIIFTVYREQLNFSVAVLQAFQSLTSGQ